MLLRTESKTCSVEAVPVMPGITCRIQEPMHRISALQCHSHRVLNSYIRTCTHTHTCLYVHIYIHALPLRHAEMHFLVPRYPNIQKFKIPKIQTCLQDSVDVKNVDFWMFWIFGVLEIWIFGIFVNFWILGILDFWIWGFQIFRPVDIRTPGSVFPCTVGATAFVILPCIYMHHIHIQLCA